ncbi:MAG: hypothetical protein AB1546_05765 [bacterium]
MRFRVHGSQFTVHGSGFKVQTPALTHLPTTYYLLPTTYFLLVIIFAMLFVSGCAKKAPPAPAAVSKTGKEDILDQTEGTGETALRLTGGEAGKSAEKKEAGAETKEERKQQLIKETGFDMIRARFSKETGRDNPFEAVSFEALGPIWGQEVAPERYRLAGTAKSQFGTFALLELGDKSVIVRGGEKMEGGTVVREIKAREVVLEKEGTATILGMKVRRRLAEEKARPGIAASKLPNLNDYYSEYLERKYGGEVPEEAKERPKDFLEYLKKVEKKEKETE